MLTFVLALASIALQQPVPRTYDARGRDRLVEIVLDEADPLLEGHGVHELVEHVADFSGTLQLWVGAEGSLDPFLRVEDDAGKLLKADDETGGRPIPFVELPVEPGQRLAILVAAAKAGQTGRAELHLLVRQETDLTRTAASAAQAAFARSQAFEQKREFQGAKSEVDAAIHALLATEGWQSSVPTIKALYSLGWQAWKLGQLESAALACRAVIENLDFNMPPDGPALAQARGMLAFILRSRGELAEARAIGEKVLASRERTLGAEDPDLLWAQHGLAWTLRLAGELTRAKELAEQVLEVRTRILKDDNLDLQWSRAGLAKVLVELGELERARGLQEQVLSVRERVLSAANSDLGWARADLAWTLGRLGELQRAKELQEQVLEAWSKSLPEDHFDLQSARANLAATLLELGEPRRALELQERVLEINLRTQAPESPDLRAARNNLALTLRSLGDLARSKLLLEQVVHEDGRSMPSESPVRLREQSNLAETLRCMGDAHGARALLERVVAIEERTMSEVDPTLQASIRGLAHVESDLGHHERAVELLRRSLASQLHGLPAEHRDVLFTKSQLGSVLFRMRDFEGARAAYQEVVDARQRVDPRNSPFLLNARLGLGASLQCLDRLEEGIAIAEQILAEEGMALPRGSAAYQIARENLILSSLRRGDASKVDEVGLQLARDLFASVLQEARGLAPREAEASVREKRGRIAVLLRLAQLPGDSPSKAELVRTTFELAESVRGVALASRSALHAAEAGGEEGPKAARLRKQIQDASAEIAAVATSGVGTSEEFLAALRRREAAERALGEASKANPRISLARIAAALGEHEFVVACWLYGKSWRDPQSTIAVPYEERIIAAVIARDAKLRWIDLGPREPIAQAAERWRTAVRAPIPRGTAASPGAPRNTEEDSAAAELARLVVAPLLAACPDATRWYVANDDVLHLVPLDALPNGAQVLGDRLLVVVLPNFAEFPQKPHPDSAAPVLLAMGGIEFDAQSTAAKGEPQIVQAAPANAERSGAWDRSFVPLPETRQEVRTIEALFAKSFAESAQARRLEEHAATKAALEDLAPQVRYLHLATHGYFAPESIASLEDRTSASRWVESQPFAEQVQGLSPWVLCGLALAGANQPPDDLGRLQGVITAEEVSALDLRQCELAVLSACDTNTGIARAGQGVASLQGALHAAGVQSAITSLWKVPDEATRELMVDFYRRIWVEKKPKLQALWEAKSKLRKAKDESGRQKYTTRDWAGWVLSGDPR